MSAPLRPSSSLNRQHRKIVRLVVTGILILILYAAAQLGGSVTGNLRDLYKPVAPGFYRVVSVSDGDTFAVSMDGVKETIRLVGVDTPETHHPSKPVQCYGKEASDFTKSLIDGGQVRLESDTKQPNRDRYGRLLRYVYLEDGRELNELLVGQGYALATDFNTSKKQYLKDLQFKTREQGRGLWGSCEILEENGRLQTGPA